jgi:peptide/nickel transport system permease protein
MTDMSIHMEHDQENLFADMGHMPAEDVTAKGRSLGIGFYLSVAFIATIILAAILAPWLPLKDPEQSYIVVGERPPYAPSREFWFGTDQLSRDVFSRTIWGARISLTVGFAAIAFGMLVGGSLGMVAGYFRGRYNAVISFCFVVMLSFPALVLAILLTSLLDRTLFTISCIIGIGSVAPVGMVSRATTVSFADREFVLASRTLGAKHPRIIVRELLPNVVIPMSALALLGVAIAIVAEGGLAFIGLSIEQGITWGKLIQNGSGRSDLEEAPWMAFAPIFVLFLTVLSLNFAGDRLRSHFDVKESAL